ncbi:uncharacterized protein LOC121915987 [Sceloporus undulatus]|uniref:uncharacterized protein LOC121915987 n=1 Tax=Sceloporus undulatus TaxID=8520 RepID=UPI001C4ADA3F|nr:uncharacterized protein LOC121915987 [Sceloporus undulatus]
MGRSSCVPDLQQNVVLSHRDNSRTLARRTASFILAKIATMNFYRYMYYALAYTSIVMLIIAIVSPFWIVQHFEEDDFHMGLWSICFGTVICSYISVVTANLAAVQGLMLIALACCFLALICSQDLLTRCLKKKVPENLISSAAFYHAGVCILFSLIIMYLRLRAIMMEVEVLHLSPDWAFFMSMFTCSFCLVLGTLRLLWQKHLVNGKKKLSTQRTVVPATASVDVKQLYP